MRRQATIVWSAERLQLVIFGSKGVAAWCRRRICRMVFPWFLTRARIGGKTTYHLQFPLHHSAEVERLEPSSAKRSGVDQSRSARHAGHPGVASRDTYDEQSDLSEADPVATDEDTDTEETYESKRYWTGEF